MYFDDPIEAFDRPIGREMTVILAGTSLVIVLLTVGIGQGPLHNAGIRSFQTIETTAFVHIIPVIYNEPRVKPTLRGLYHVGKVNILSMVVP